MGSGILILAILGIATLISVQNITAVSVAILHWQIDTTLPVVIFAALLSGVVVAQLVRQLMAGRVEKPRKV